MNLTYYNQSKHVSQTVKNAHFVVNEKCWHHIVEIKDNPTCKDNKETKLVMLGHIFPTTDMREHNVSTIVLLQKV